MARRLRSLPSSRALLAFGLLIGVVTLHYVGVLRPIENAVVRMLEPAQVALYDVTSSRVDNSAESAQYEGKTPEELTQRIVNLEEQVDSLTVENAYLQTLVDETTLLENQIAFLQEQSYQSVTARVASRSTDTISQSLIINKGASDGVEEGLPVIIENGILVGTIESVHEYSSVVLLTTSYDSRISSSVQNKEKSAGIVRGAFNLSMLMEFIPQFDEIAVGESVFTNGTDEQIPNGLVIGRIEEIYQEAGSLFQEASLSPLYRSSEISVVSVILP